ncbi:MAG: hypothetical protein HOB14_13175 [Gammaproteobacteria bacterium]|jgi:hypothetical protein|nr:hypothetical protein [Gammaproteobacteria bacterium]MBT6702606.1 hypothetical protein [Gammaproteobacteria bacterium]
MTKDEKLIQLILDQNKKIQNTPTQISNQHKSTKTLLYAVWFTSFATLFMIGMYGVSISKRTELNNQVEYLKGRQIKPAHKFQPVMYAPYTVVKPEDNCPALNLIELGGIRTYQKL